MRPILKTLHVPRLPVNAPPAVNKQEPETKASENADSATSAATKSTKGEPSLAETVPQVVGAIEQISNYFGSTSASHSGQVRDHPDGIPGQSKEDLGQGKKDSGQRKEDLGQGKEDSGQRKEELGQSKEDSRQSKEELGRSKESGHVSADKTIAKGQSSAQDGGNTAIGKLSRESIGRLAAIAEQLVQHPEGPGNIPSYAPEKCITGYGDGKGSPLEQAPVTAEESKEPEGISKLKEILISEKDIFGGRTEESCSEDEDTGDICPADTADINTNDMVTGDISTGDMAIDTADTTDTGDTAVSSTVNMATVVAVPDTIDTTDICDTSDTIHDLADPDWGSGEREGGGEVKTKEKAGVPVVEGPSEEEIRAEFQKLTALSTQLEHSELVTWSVSLSADCPSLSVSVC